MTHPQYAPAPEQMGQRPRNGFGVAALVLSLIGLIVGLFMVTFGFALFLGILGLIFGLVGLRRVKRRIATNRGVSLAGVILSALSLILGIIGAVVTFNAVDDAVQSLGTPSSAVADPNAPAAFPGATAKDKVVQAGEQVDADGVLITAGQLVPGKDTAGKTLCSTVSYTNNSKEATSFNGGFDWKLQDPNGVILMNTYGGSDNQLQSGQLAPGGTMSADVCFDAPTTDTPGQYVVLLDPSFRFSSDRIAWLNTL
ncbi:DUF4190 domain-containing protein [Kineococcus aurantiacus]|uniref:DUF4190 domain-containing protein n=1 Tax=Kineococcus aurantiacus TaxID=37633 RepID=UPI0031D7E92D